MSASKSRKAELPTACLIIIGNEILSGKTQDANLQFLAEELGKLGVQLAEARVIADVEATIIATVNELREKYTYVFTTGGIGPTHDDITALSVAKAFGRELVLNQEAVEGMKRVNIELNEARLKMAHVPEGASLIKNPRSFAPGFKIENVYVLAGIPSVARAMFGTLLDELNAGAAIHSANVDVYLKEGDIAKPLEAIALEFDDPVAYVRKFGEKIPNARPSMLLDHMARRKAEVDNINGAIPRVKRAHGSSRPCR